MCLLNDGNLARAHTHTHKIIKMGEKNTQIAFYKIFTHRESEIKSKRNEIKSLFKVNLEFGCCSLFSFDCSFSCFRFFLSHFTYIVFYSDFHLRRLKTIKKNPTRVLTIHAKVDTIVIAQRRNEKRKEKKKECIR